MMFDRSPGWRRRLVLRSLLVWSVFALLAWLDGRVHIQAAHAAVFSAISAAISFVAGILGDVGAGIAAAAEATVTFLAHSLGWLASRTWGLMRDTGAMFSKVWTGAKFVWNDAVKPFFGWLHDKFEALKGWFDRTLSPVLKWAQRARGYIEDQYRRFVRPILNALHTTKTVLDVLARLHVPFAQKLENVVADIESTLLENYLRIIGYVNHAIDFLNSVLTSDGLLQRACFLRSAERDVFLLWRVMENSRRRELTAAEQEALVRSSETAAPARVVEIIGEYWSGTDNDDTAPLQAAQQLAASVWPDTGGATA